MAFAGLQVTLNLYTMREAELTNRLSDIMQDITRASAKTTDVLQETNEKRSAVNAEAENNQAYADSVQYDNDLNAIEDDFELQLAEINQWESQLEIEKEELETEIQATTSYKESFTAALKQNVQKSFKYGQNQ